MRGPYRESFSLGDHIRQIVRALLDTPDNLATTFLLSEKIDVDQKTLNMEISSQAHKYPAFNYNPNNSTLSLTKKHGPLMKSVRFSFKRLKKSFFVSRRLEGKIYKWAARTYNASDFWDQIQRAICHSDVLSRFLLINFLGYANLRRIAKSVQQARSNHIE
jgi:hypothetical protein